MAALAGATTPVIRLRDNWMIIDPVVARRARKRKAAQTIKPVVALQSALTGTIELDGEPVEVHPGATLAQGARPDRRRVDRRAARVAGRAGGDRCATTSATA